MGTRGLVGFIILGRKRGFYNHFDSYPEGLGEDIVRFFMALFEAPKARFKENLEKIKWVDPAAKPSAEWYQYYVDRGFGRNYSGNMARYEDRCSSSLLTAPITPDGPQMYFGCPLQVQGAQSLPYILDNTIKHLPQQTNFEGSSLCEWCYWIDMEKELLGIDGVGEEILWVPFADFKQGRMHDIGQRTWWPGMKTNQEVHQQLRGEEAGEVVTVVPGGDE